MDRTCVTQYGSMEDIAQTNNIIFADRINNVLINVVHNRCLK